IILLTTLVYLITYEPPRKGNEYFTTEPETWLTDRYETSEEGDMEVDVYKATRTKAAVDFGRQDYYTQGDLTSFFYNGFYKGDSFTSLYAGDMMELLNLTREKPLEEQQRIAEERGIMRIDSKLNPHDGIIDSFILAREENNKFVFYIFLDEDWKNNIGKTNILWGDNFKDKNNMHLRSFDFSESENGIYINKIDEDVDWNDLDTIKGGMMVGEVDYEVLSRLVSYEEFNETFIMVR
ncbi:hypothetical protein ACFLZ6_01305, partial [Nanoarchaeota archaeon]